MSRFLVKKRESSSGEFAFEVVLKKVPLVTLFFILGCASPEKKIVFKSRVPTVESPLFNENFQLGIATQLESQRFEVELTRNLVNDFSFRKNGDIFSGDGDSLDIEGLDLGLTGALGKDLFAVQVEVSGDYFELKTGLGSLYPRSPSRWLLALGGGVYRTAVDVRTGKCSIFCGSTSDSQANQEIENRIETQQRGQEVKLSGTLGYRFAEKWIFFLGYSQMNYQYYALARDPTRSPAQIEFNENFRGEGYGGGFAFQAHRNFQMSLSAHNIAISWNEQRRERAMGTLNLNWLFR